MKVVDLKKLINDLPDDMEVVLSGSDHSYAKIGRFSAIVKAEFFPKQKHFAQYYDEHNKSDPDNPVVNVFWIDDGRY